MIRIKRRQKQQKKLDLEELNKKLKIDLERERKEMDRDSEEDAEKVKKHEEFVKKRKQHYNVKEQMRMARQMLKEEDHPDG